MKGLLEILAVVEEDRVSIQFLSATLRCTIYNTTLSCTMLNLILIRVVFFQLFLRMDNLSIMVGKSP